MRAKSIEVTLAGGMDAMAEFAIGSNPNVAGRIKLDPSARKEIFDYYRMLTPIGYANALRALLQMDYITDRLGEITVPTLLVCGDARSHARDPEAHSTIHVRAAVAGRPLREPRPAGSLQPRRERLPEEPRLTRTALPNTRSPVSARK